MPPVPPDAADPAQPADPGGVLVTVVRELEAHAAGQGWNRPASLFALVDTAELLEAEPGLAQVLGIDLGLDGEESSGLTPVEQDPVPPDRSLEQVLEQIVWPPEVHGCAAVVERLVLPPEADEVIPEDPADAAEYAAAHPERQEVRIVAAVTRDGEQFCALRLRSHDDDESVLSGPDVVPGLLQLLHATLETETPDEPLTDPARSGPQTHSPDAGSAPQ